MTAFDPQGGTVTVPAQTGIISVIGSDFKASADGDVSPSNSTIPPGALLWLDGISFRAES